jgi:hypothetical protein
VVGLVQLAGRLGEARPYLVVAAAVPSDLQGVARADQLRRGRPSHRLPLGLRTPARIRDHGLDPADHRRQ